LVLVLPTGDGYGLSVGVAGGQYSGCLGMGAVAMSHAQPGDDCGASEQPYHGCGQVEPGDLYGGQ